LLNQARAVDRKLASLVGGPVQGMKILEIGPGQRLLQLSYFATRNDVWGIDLDMIVDHMSLRECVQMAKKNGWMRTWKTIARKITHIDSKLKTELVSQLGLRDMPKLHVVQMDAAKMTFSNDQFDVVFSRSVFEHLSEPETVISEMRRVLKPGGVLSLAIHLFTSDSGCHDTRIFVGNRGTLPFWAHLQPEHEHAVRSNSYLNKLTLADWRRIFQSEMPGSDVVASCDAGSVDRQELAKLRSQGKLMTYSDEELLTVTIEVSWRKPLHPQEVA
jgi:SAM-dependent methyltransferase